ncbi:uncharacterized protein LOC127505660 isoform X9 [Ctenopharyngodon idella]|uniref:uncharacterized protein LOC127505660 isoform X9 n=1 Tax=Ctenopharyngodon idella TaxID=7959 RepID=UPI002232609B|nr:uncharacterized protein LOC127505660 isoform X9 [Ctenopharyngodon idella]
MAEWKMLCLPSVLLLWPQIFSTTLQDNGHPGSGCLTTTDTKVLMKYLRSYKLQHKPLFPVDAVRFLTIKGNTICSDPSSPWAIKAMKYLDAKKKPQSASSTAHQSVTAAPTKISMINTKSAQSSTTQIWSTPVKKQVYSYTQNLKDIIGHNTQKTESKAEFPTPRTTLEQDWRGSTETTFQLDGLAWEEEEEDAVTGSACLTTTDTEVPLNNLRSYTLQHKPLFPVDAVRFLTIKGNTICSDPSSPWAIKAMKYLNAKKKPQSGSNTAHKSVTAAPKKTSTINMTRSSAQIETQTSGRK